MVDLDMNPAPTAAARRKMARDHTRAVLIEKLFAARSPAEFDIHLDEAGLTLDQVSSATWRGVIRPGLPTPKELRNKILAPLRFHVMYASLPTGHKSQSFHLLPAGASASLENVAARHRLYKTNAQKRWGLPWLSGLLANAGAPHHALPETADLVGTLVDASRMAPTLENPSPHTLA